MIDIFPRGVAYGKSFYDRETERKKLKQNIANTVHTVLIAPRRYGKTSLMTQVLYENKIEHIWIDFMTITSREDVQIKLLQKISDLVVKIVPVAEKLKKLLTKYFSKLKPEIMLKIPGISLSLRLSQENPSREGIENALIGLDNLAKELNMRLVFVFDEFQEIIKIDKDSTLQGSIRHAVERAKHITYLFSGSKHRPLRRMFSGKESPLYALCETLELSKIAKNEYISYMNSAANEKWGEPLPASIIDKILSYSDRYPKYINALCGAIWTVGTEPTPDLVDKLWQSYILSKKTDLTEDLSDLTLNQRRLLQWLCFKPTTEIYKKETLASLKMSQSSVQKSIAALLEKSFVTEDAGVYKVLDPIWAGYFDLF
jgi:hypothetical protein